MAGNTMHILFVLSGIIAKKPLSAFIANSDIFHPENVKKTSEGGVPDELAHAS